MIDTKKVVATGGLDVFIDPVRGVEKLIKFGVQSTAAETKRIEEDRQSLGGQSPVFPSELDTLESKISQGPEGVLKVIVVSQISNRVELNSDRGCGHGWPFEMCVTLPDSSFSHCLPD